MQSKETIARVIPQFFPEHWLDSAGIVFTDFPSRIRIGYVLPGEGGYSYILLDELTSLRIPIAELHAAAIANLGQLPSASVTIADVPGGAEGWLSATEDNFGAVRILLPSVQRKFCEKLGDEFLVSLPHRDDCFCWSVTQSADRQKRNMQEALESFSRDDYNLTPDVLRYSHAGFRLHCEQAVP